MKRKFLHLLKKTGTITRLRRQKRTLMFGLGGATPSTREGQWRIFLLEELRSLLSHFFVKVRKLNGEEFEPGTLTSFQRSFDRYSRQHSKNYNIIQDKIFEKSREALKSKRKQLRLSGKGGRPNKALHLINDELEKFWSAEQLGDHSPSTLLRTVWLNDAMHFSWRARDEHRKRLLEDLETRREESGERHMEDGARIRDENWRERVWCREVF